MPLYTDASFTYDLSFKRGCVVKEEDKMDRFCPVQKLGSYIATFLQRVSLTCKVKGLQEMLQMKSESSLESTVGSQRTSEARVLT